MRHIGVGRKYSSLKEGGRGRLRPVAWERGHLSRGSGPKVRPPGALLPGFRLLLDAPARGTNLLEVRTAGSLNSRNASGRAAAGYGGRPGRLNTILTF